MRWRRSRARPRRSCSRPAPKRWRTRSRSRARATSRSGGDRLHRRLPRPQLHGDVADRQDRAVQARLRAACPGDVYHVPLPVAHYGVERRGRARTRSSRCSRPTSPRSEVAAIILEPVQGEGGFHQAPPELMQRAARDVRPARHRADRRRGADRHRPHRTWFGIEHTGVKPDLITVAKSLAGGFPLSGVIGRAAVMDAVGAGRPGRHLRRSRRWPARRRWRCST